MLRLCLGVGVGQLLHTYCSDIFPILEWLGLDSYFDGLRLRLRYAVGFFYILLLMYGSTSVRISLLLATERTPKCSPRSDKHVQSR